MYSCSSVHRYNNDNRRPLPGKAMARSIRADVDFSRKPERAGNRRPGGTAAVAGTCGPPGWVSGAVVVDGSWRVCPKMAPGRRSLPSSPSSPSSLLLASASVTSLAANLQGLQRHPGRWVSRTPAPTRRSLSPDRSPPLTVALLAAGPGGVQAPIEGQPATALSAWRHHGLPTICGNGGAGVWSDQAGPGIPPVAPERA